MIGCCLPDVPSSNLRALLDYIMDESCAEHYVPSTLKNVPHHQEPLISTYSVLRNPYEVPILASSIPWAIAHEPLTFSAAPPPVR